MASAFGVGAANMFVSGQNNAENNPFSLQPFGGTSPFGQQTGTSFFGNTSTGNFGQTSLSPSTTTFGATCSPFGGSSVCGQKPAFGGFGSNTQTNTFVSSSQPAFGGTTTSPGFGATTTWAFGASTTPTFSGNTNSSLGFGSTSPSFGTQSSPFAQATTSAVASGGFGQPGGSRVAGYSNTSWRENGTNTKLQSISGMNVYNAKIHEELRWEDYQRGDKGGPTTAGMRFAPSSGQSNSFSSSKPFLQTTPNPFFANATTNPFSSSSSQTTPNLFSANATTNPPTAQSNPFSSRSITFSQTTPNPFSANATTFPSTAQSNPFSSSTSTTFLQTTPNPFSANATTNPSTTQSNPFSSSTSTTFLQTTPNSFSANAMTNPSTSHSNPFSSTTLTAFAQTPNPFSTNPTTFPSTAQSNPFNSSTSLTPSQFSANATPNPYNGQTGSSWGKTGIFTSPLNSFTASNLAQTPASSSAPSLQTLPVQTSTGINFINLGTLPSNLSQPTLPAQTTNNFNFCNLAPNQSDGSGSGNGLNSVGPNVGQLSSNQKTAVAQPVAVRNPFGTLPAMPHMTIGNTGTSSSVQYGISSMPVVDKPTPVRISPVLTSRLLSHHRLRVPARKYHPKHNGSRVAFFSDEYEVPRTPNADAFLIPRENPRALIVQPIEHWPPNSCKKEASVVIHENGYAAKSGSGEEQCHLNRRIQKPAGGFSDDSMNHKEDSHVTISGHRATEPAIVYDNTAEIEAMMPKLRHSEYYTEPQIQALATKERDEPGFCSHVKNFIVGRHGYGNIKFLWHTDVRHLDLDSLVQFNNREVIVYMDDSKKPPVGQGLNKPAEVTLLNITCYDKKTGNQILEGPRIEKYKEMLKKKSEDQGAEFLSYHPVKGEWKFRVSHF